MPYVLWLRVASHIYIALFELDASQSYNKMESNLGCVASTEARYAARVVYAQCVLRPVVKMDCRFGCSTVF